MTQPPNCHIQISGVSLLKVVAMDLCPTVADGHRWTPQLSRALLTALLLHQPRAFADALGTSGALRRFSV